MGKLTEVALIAVEVAPQKLGAASILLLFSGMFAYATLSTVPNITISAFLLGFLVAISLLLIAAYVIRSTIRDADEIYEAEKHFGIHS